jgi:hypothetical protein
MNAVTNKTSWLQLLRTIETRRCSYLFQDKTTSIIGRKKQMSLAYNFKTLRVLQHIFCVLFKLSPAVSPALQQPLLKLLQGSWHSSSPLWGSRFESRVQIPSTFGVIMVTVPSFKSLHKQPLQLAPFKLNSLPVIDKLLPIDQQV